MYQAYSRFTTSWPWASSDCTAFSSYLGVFELFAVQCCADVHFFGVIRERRWSIPTYVIFETKGTERYLNNCSPRTGIAIVPVRKEKVQHSTVQYSVQYLGNVLVERVIQSTTDLQHSTDSSGVSHKGRWRTYRYSTRWALERAWSNQRYVSVDTVRSPLLAVIRSYFT
jgi:hypothetical protein